jgi:hypothetical protein
MSPFRLSSISMSAVLIAAVLPGATASAQVMNAADRNIVIQQGLLQGLENRVQRQQFQQQQQQFRAQDRQIVPTQRPEVPQVKPTCQLQPSGDSFVSTCH